MAPKKKGDSIPPPCAGCGEPAHGYLSLWFHPNGQWGDVERLSDRRDEVSFNAPYCRKCFAHSVKIGVTLHGGQRAPA